MSIEQKVTDLIEAAIVKLGYELIRVKQVDQQTIQVMIDKDHGIAIEDCEHVTKLIKPILQVAGVADDYGLEVSSPGVERPLIKEEHFVRFIGSKIRLTTHQLIDGQKKFRGNLKNVDLTRKLIELEVTNKIVNIALDQIQSANLVFEFN